MTPSTTDAEAIARDLNAATSLVIKQMHEAGLPICMREGGTTWRTYHAGFDLSLFSQRITDACVDAILSYLASRREAQEPVQITMQDVRLMAGEGPLTAKDTLAAVNAHLRRFHRHTASPAPAGETIEELRQALGDARDEASDSLRTLDAIAEFVGCPHDEELTVDHVRQHYMRLENAAQRQGIKDAGRIANAEARAAGAPAGEVERLREALEPFANEADSWADTVPDTHRSLCTEPGSDYPHLGSETTFTVGDLRRAKAIILHREKSK